MTKQALQFELSEKLPYRVRGIRNGLLFRFDLKHETDAQKQSAFVCTAITKKAEALAGLLGENAVLRIEGATVNEMDRLRIEQHIAKVSGNAVRVLTADERMCGENAQSRTFVGTVRGGMRICADADLTVVGDVHAGARLEAGGNVVVLGVLSGTVWAGQAEGESAIVAAWGLQPAEIRIADCIGQKPSRSYKADAMPEYACLQNGEIIIKKYTDRI